MGVMHVIYNEFDTHWPCEKLSKVYKMTTLDITKTKKNFSAFIWFFL